MIATTLFGGLGNQMFIYAAVRGISLQKKTGMAFNMNTGFATDYLYHRSLELEYLNTSLPKSKLQTFDLGYIGRIFRKFSVMIGRNILAPHYKYVKEELLPSDNYFFNDTLYQSADKNLYLEGYWQSPRYFEEYEDVIRNDFKIKIEICITVKEELEYWKSFKRPIVFIGVRRYQECNADYMPDICSATYYNNAIDIIKGKIVNPLFVVFSQATEWCKENLNIGDGIIANPKKGQYSSIEDLYLMTNCDHAIVSNSSFYWWGAWLQVNPKHIVIAPDNFKNVDQYCDSWIKIKAH